MKIYLRTLTPVHIGTGEALSSLDYIIHGNTYYRISQDTFIEFLLKEDESLIEDYALWAAKQAGEVDNLKINRKKLQDSMGRQDYNQKLSQLQQDFNLLNFSKQHKIDQKFIAFLKSNEDKRVISYPIVEKAASKKLQVRSMISHPNDHSLYIPGSSIKGAIRTALLFRAWKNYGNKYDQKLIQDLRNALSSQDRPRRIAQRVGKEIEYCISYCGILKRGKKNFKDVQQDLFKFLQISDAKLSEGQDKKGELAKSDLYLVSNVSRNRKQKKFCATRQAQSPMLEVLGRGTQLEVEINFHLKNLFAIYSSWKKGKKEIWIDIEEKVQQLFGLNLKKVNSGNINSFQEQVEDYIFSAIDEFSKAQINFDQNWLNQQFLKENIHRETIKLSKQAFHKSFSGVFNYPFQEGHLLRVGYGTGFAGTTELLYLFDKPDLTRVFKQVMEKLGLGKKPGMTGRYTANPEKFPKSRTLLRYPDAVQPLGWIELSRSPNWPLSQVMHTSHQEEKQPQKNIEASYSKARVKQGTIVDAIFLEAKGKREKIFELYLEEGNKQNCSLFYFAPLDKGAIYQVEIRSINKKTGKVENIAFRKEKE